jgi:hypothetical protein
LEIDGEMKTEITNPFLKNFKWIVQTKIVESNNNNENVLKYTKI